MPIITLLTDFGACDGYVGALKGVIAEICPRATVVDLAHGIPAGDVVHGAFALATASECFPAGTIHVAVVDPGVGSSRRGVLVETINGLFVGPDNGLLTLAAAPVCAVYVLDQPRFFRRAVSHTFHGRDVFAPVAAFLATGVSPDEVGSRTTDDLVRLVLPPVRARQEAVEGTVVFCDRFGNLITNLRPSDLPVAGDLLHVELGDVVIEGLSRTYSDRPSGSALALIGSSGYLEVAVRDGSAGDLLGLGRGTPVVVRKGSQPR